MDINIDISEKQKLFLDADCDEVLYGGAAGGGKSYGQVLDAFLHAVRYPDIRQLILRTTFPELERSLILTALSIIPKDLYKYNASKHMMKFINGSVIEFGYLTNDTDAIKYQSAEYDIIRFDELTHFSEYQYTYMLSRIRGVNDFPKQIKSSTNPGGRGHNWVKERFINIAPYGTVYKDGGRSRIFIPAKVQDNTFLMEKDPAYINRLEAQGENERKALLYGDWDIFEGQYFPEFNKEIHVCHPFDIPQGYKRFRCLDYGLDMTACYWVAVDREGGLILYRELYQNGLTISEAAKKIVQMTPENEQISYTAASPDLWNRRQDSGLSGIEIMAQNGLVGLIKADNRRVEGWRVLREYLRPYEAEGRKRSRICIFNHLINLIRCLPSLVYDSRNTEDCADYPHEVTHAPEALRYGVMSRPMPNLEKAHLTGRRYTKTELEDLKININTVVKRK